MLVVIGIIIILLGGLIVWFNISYSPTKKEFRSDLETIKDNNYITDANEYFTKDDFSKFPIAIQKYVEHCGYIGKPKMSYMMMEYNDVDFKQGKKGPNLKIHYIQYNFAKDICRMALIDSRMFGVPFEGYDYYQNGVGGMKGVIAKAITLFDQQGSDMDQACLATYLAESLFIPTALFHDNISFIEISELEVQASITYKGQTVRGVFLFNSDYEMVAFTTKDRGIIGADGTVEYVPWSALCGDYKMSHNGIYQPAKFQAVWNYPDEDFIYFDGEISRIEYGY